MPKRQVWGILGQSPGSAVAVIPKRLSINIHNAIAIHALLEQRLRPIDTLLSRA
jgi:hypothetical protein